MDSIYVYAGTVLVNNYRWFNITSNKDNYLFYLYTTINKAFPDLPEFKNI
jgi:hypothetical protein